jgi:hypothetical protein
MGVSVSGEGQEATALALLAASTGRRRGAAIAHGRHAAWARAWEREGVRERAGPASAVEPGARRRPADALVPFSCF